MTQLLRIVSTQTKEEKVMEKKSGKKPAAEPAPKTFPPSIIREEGKFLVAGKEETYTITVFDAHGKDEGPIDSGMMILRGSKVKASMFTRYGAFLFQHRNDIPAEYEKYTFIFPMGENDQFVQLLSRKPDEWWCLLKWPAVEKWNNSYKLVRFHPDLPLPKQLPAGSTKTDV